MSKKPEKLKWFKDFVQNLPERRTGDRSLMDKAIIDPQIFKSVTPSVFRYYMGLECLKRYAKLTGQSFSRATLEFPSLIFPISNNMITQLEYWREFHTLCGKLEYLSGGEYICQGKPNQRKFLILCYFLKNKSATSSDVSRSLNISLANASFLLKWYKTQGLLWREQKIEKRRGRRSFVYGLTEIGKQRLTYLHKTVSLPRKTTKTSETYRLWQLQVAQRINILLKKLKKTAS